MNSTPALYDFDKLRYLCGTRTSQNYWRLEGKGSRRVVTLCSDRDIACIVDHVGRVEQLQIVDCFDISHPAIADKTLELVSCASPVGLYLSVETDTQNAGSDEFWAALAEQAPRLRSLEIKIEVKMAAGQPQYDKTYEWVVS